jgi:hypothetical protein
MSLYSEISFQQILAAVKTLTPSQKKQLINILEVSTPPKKQKSDFTRFLLSGPVFSKKQIDLIMENRRSFNKWRNITY